MLLFSCDPLLPRKCCPTVEGITFVNTLLGFLSDCSTLTCINSDRIILTSDLVSKTCLFT